MGWLLANRELDQRRRGRILRRGCLLTGGQNTRILDILERLLSRTHGLCRKEPRFFTKPHQTPATCLSLFYLLLYHSEFDQSEARLIADLRECLTCEFVFDASSFDLGDRSVHLCRSRLSVDGFLSGQPVSRRDLLVLKNTRKTWTSRLPV